MDHPDTHDPREDPEGCLSAALHELAGAEMREREICLRHGELALNQLVRQLEDVRDEAAHWRGHADEYAIAILNLARVDPPDPYTQDVHAAIERLRANSGTSRKNM